MINVQKALPSSWTRSLYELLRRHLLFHMQRQEVTEIKHKGEKDILISWPYHTYQFECSCNGFTSLYFMSTVPSFGVVTCGSFVAQARTAHTPQCNHLWRCTSSPSPNKQPTAASMRKILHRGNSVTNGKAS